MRIILLSLLVFLALSQTFIVLPVNVVKNAPTASQTPLTPPTQINYKVVPLTQMDKVFVFLLQQINSFYPYVINFKLFEVKERTSQDGQKRQVVFCYTKESKTPGNITYKNDSIIMALGTDNMTYFVFFDGLTINYANYTQYLKKPKNITTDNKTPAVSTPANNESTDASSTGDIIVGGKTPADFFKLNPDQIQIQNYLFSKVQKLKKWTLIAYKTQVVAGTNYIFTYYDALTNKNEQYTVWSQPWNNNFLEIKYPNGTRINNQPVIASLNIAVGDSSNNTISTPQVTLQTSFSNRPPRVTSVNNGSTDGSSTGDMIVGGKTSGDISKLSPDQIQIQNYLLTKVQKLKKWTLVSYKTQVVAGKNYIFTYNDPSTNKTEQYTVWSQPWNNNFLEIKYPNGTRINNQPVIASLNIAVGDSSNNTISTPKVSLNSSDNATKTPIAGGIDTLDVKQLTDGQAQIKNFIIKKVPKLATWQLTNLEVQVVQGMKYYFTFKDPQSSKTERYTAWSWDGSVQLTLPDGSITRDSITITFLPDSTSDTLSVGGSLAAQPSA